MNKEEPVYTAVPAYKMYAISMLIALVGMQLDLRYHELNAFETYFTWQHGVIYIGIAIFGFAVITRYMFRKRYVMKLDVATKIAMVVFS